VNYVCSNLEAGTPATYEIDKNYVFYHWNWYADGHWIECIDTNWKVFAFSAMNGIVSAVSGIYVGWIPDYFGRKATMVWGLASSLLF
jgi:MFS family permease